MASQKGDGQEVRRVLEAHRLHDGSYGDRRGQEWRGGDPHVESHAAHPKTQESWKLSSTISELSAQELLWASQVSCPGGVGQRLAGEAPRRGSGSP